MDALPQVQSIISSKNVSTKEAQRILKKFLATQKTFFLEHETEPVNDNGDNVEEYFNMDDKEDMLGYEEFEQRIGAMVDSLSDDYFSRQPTNITNLLQEQEEENLSKVQAETEAEPEADATNIKEDENGINESSVHKEEDSQDDPSVNIKREIADSPPSATSINSNSKAPLDKIPDKERKKQQKKEMKEQKKRSKKEAKEARKAEKERQKKLKKAKKEKRGREPSDDNSTAKRLKI